MKKSCLLMLLSVAFVSASMPALAQNQTQTKSSDNKVVGGFKTLGRGVMWGPKKFWAGMQAVGKKVSGK